MTRLQILIAVLAAAALPGTAVAADLYVPQPEYVEPALPSWSTCYVGARITYSKGDLLTQAPLSDYSTEPQGPGFSPVAGCDYQPSDSLLVGVVVDANLASRTDLNTEIPGQTIETSIPWSGTARLRAGLATETTLFYATGGLAVAYVESHLSVTQGIDVTADATHVGWTAGLGIEHKLTDNLSIVAEYLYADLGEADYTYAGANFSGDPNNVIDTLTQSLTNQTIQVGLNFRF